jgi:hypothetical protein
VTSPTRSSAVEGNMVVAVFTMDDGSTLNMTGALSDSTEAHISAPIFVVNGGSCGTPPSFVHVVQLDRQS